MLAARCHLTLLILVIPFLSISVHRGEDPSAIYYTCSCLSQCNSAVEAQLVYQLHVDPTAWPAFALTAYGTEPIQNHKSQTDMFAHHC